MTAWQWLGAGMLALVFAALVGGMGLTIGWRYTLTVWGTAIFLASFVIIGAHLLMGDLP
jgi:hypothetical protein